MYLDKCFPWSWLLVLVTLKYSIVLGADDFNVLHRDGSYEFGYDNPDSFHHSQANRNNVVRGDFGSRNPQTGAIDTVQYTAGPRGFRPRGKNIVRKYDLGQVRTGPIGSRDDPYFDPNEDPSYNFAFNTRTYNRQEAANRLGDVTGRYSFFDDVGERHNVEYIAGKHTGFHVKSPVPDNKPLPFGPLRFVGKGRPVPRGRTTIQRGLDGSYRFVSGGPDQRRTETSDSTGHVRGSYTYLDDKGVRHSVHYIAGPETGYRVLKNVKSPHLPTIYPFGRPEIVPPDFYDYPSEDVFDTAASGHIKPPKGGGGKPPRPSRPTGGGDDFNFDNGPNISGGPGFDNTGKPGGSGSFGSGSGSNRPGGVGSGSDGDDFGQGTTGSGTGGTDFGTGPGSGPGASGPSGGGSGPSGSGVFGSGSRPGSSGGGTRPPFGSGGNRPGGSRPPRPSYEDDGLDDFGDLFGGPVRPGGSSTLRPPSGGGGGGISGGGSSGGGGSGGGGSGGGGSGGGGSGGPTGGGGGDDGSYKPSGDDGSYRPGSGGSGGRPGGDFGGSRPTGPSGGSEGGFTSRPGGSRPGRPNYDDTGSNEVNDFGLFDDSGSTSRPSGGSGGGGSGGAHIGISPIGPPGTGGGRPGGIGGSRPGGIGGSGGVSGEGGNRYDEIGTIVRNLGDRLFSVPPGVSVRAHVQAIDLLPLGPRSPSPSDQLKAEARDELRAETTNINEELHTEASSDTTTITSPPNNITEPHPL